MFSGCLSIVASMRGYVHLSLLPVSTVTPERVEGFSPNLIQIFYATVKLTDYILKSVGQGQGRRYRDTNLSKLLQWEEASTSMLGRQSI